MQYIRTIEGYPALLATKTRSRFFSEDMLTHGNRTTPWVYLAQNPKGRWQVLVPDPNERGNVLCIAGAPKAAMVLPEMVAYAFEHGILKRGSGYDRPWHTRMALADLGSFVRWEDSQAQNAAR